jgi:hypothetical protein
MCIIRFFNFDIDELSKFEIKCKKNVSILFFNSPIFSTFYLTDFSFSGSVILVWLF